jgi:hypothetical protein
MKVRFAHMFHPVTHSGGRARWRLLAACLASAALCFAGLAYGSNPFLEVPAETEALGSAAYRRESELPFACSGRCAAY